jgi:hypothetical protein
MDHFPRLRSLRRQTSSVVFAAAATLFLGQAPSMVSSLEAFDVARDLPTVSRGSLCFEGRCYTHRMNVYDPRHAVVVIDAELFTPDGVFGAACTGALLDSGRHVLTAAHCVSPDDDSMRIGKVSVRIWGAAAPLYATNVSVHSGWLERDDRHTEHDVAVIELRDRIWWIDGYALDTVERHEGVLEAWSAQWNETSGPEPTIVRCNIAADTVGLRHNHLTAPCKLRPGGSGGPLFSVGDDDTRIVGVLHALDDQGENYWSMLDPAAAFWANLVDVPFGDS